MGYLKAASGPAMVLALTFTLSAQTEQQPLESLPPQQQTATVPEQLHRVEPPPPDATPEELERRGDHLRREKHYVDALDYYRAAHSKSGDRAVIYNKIGMTQLMLLRTKAAKKDFERAVRLDKSYAEAHNNLGVIHYMEQNYGRAVRHYRRAIQLNPKAASFYSNLGTAYFARKDVERAAEAYNRALELDPLIFERQSGAGVAARMARPQDRAQFHYVVAKTFARIGDAERSLLYLKKAVEDGYDRVQDAYTETDFNELRKDPRFEMVMAGRVMPPEMP